jgi:hypothetical protein
MTRIVVGSPNLTQPLLLYPDLGPAMLEQHRRSYVKYEENDNKRYKNNYYPTTYKTPRYMHN